MKERGSVSPEHIVNEVAAAMSAIAATLYAQLSRDENMAGTSDDDRRKFSEYSGAVIALYAYARGSVREPGQEYVVSREHSADRAAILVVRAHAALFGGNSLAREFVTSYRNNVCEMVHDGASSFDELLQCDVERMSLREMASLPVLFLARVLASTDVSSQPSIGSRLLMSAADMALKAAAILVFDGEVNIDSFQDAALMFDGNKTLH